MRFFQKPLRIRGGGVNQVSSSGQNFWVSPGQFFQKEKPLYPFFGFHPDGHSIGLIGRFSDSEGNQCPLRLLRGEGYAPCFFDLRGEQPQWRVCLFNTQENCAVIRNNQEHWRVYPKKFHNGMSLKRWAKYVMQEEEFPFS